MSEAKRSIRREAFKIMRRDPDVAEKAPWIKAAAEGDLETLKRLASQSLAQINGKLASRDVPESLSKAWGLGKVWGLTPLMTAITNGRDDCVA